MEFVLDHFWKRNNQPHLRIVIKSSGQETRDESRKKMTGERQRQTWEVNSDISCEQTNRCLLRRRENANQVCLMIKLSLVCGSLNGILSLDSVWKNRYKQTDSCRTCCHVGWLSWISCQQKGVENTMIPVLLFVVFSFGHQAEWREDDGMQSKTGIGWEKWKGNLSPQLRRRRNDDERWEKGKWRKVTALLFSQVLIRWGKKRKSDSK